MSGILGQCAPEAATLTDFVTIVAWGGEIHEIVVCNRSAAAATFRIAIAPGGAVDDPAHYLFYDEPIAGHATAFYPHGHHPLGHGDVVRCYASSADLTFQFYGFGGAGALSAPTDLIATAGAGGILLEWTAHGRRIANFQVERSADGLTFAAIGSAVPPWLLDAGVAPATTYYYRVRAANATLVSPYSNIVSAEAL